MCNLPIDFFSRKWYYNYRKRSDERMIVEKLISHCLGVAQFVQGIGVTYEEVDPVYNHYKKLFELLLDR